MAISSVAHGAITVRWDPRLPSRLAEEVFGDAIVDQHKEAGGLLLGGITHSGTAIEINLRLFIPVPIGYGSGSFYHLSTEEKRKLEGLIARCMHPEWTMLGFYRSDLRPGFQPDPDDLYLLKEHVTNSPGILFLLKRQSGNEAIGSLFVLDGSEATKMPDLLVPFSERAEGTDSKPGPAVSARQSPSNEVAAGLAALASATEAAARITNSARPKAARRRALKDAPEGQTRGYAAIRNALSNQRRAWLSPAARGSHGRKTQFAAIGLAALLIAGLVSAIWSVREKHRSQQVVAVGNPKDADLGLGVKVISDHLRVTWNPSAPPVANAVSGTLSIKDGLLQRDMPLEAAELHRGSAVYSPQTDDVTFELRVGDVAQSIVTVGFLARLQMNPPPGKESRERSRASLALEIPAASADQDESKASRSPVADSSSPSASTSNGERFKPPARVRHTAPTELISPPDVHANDTGLARAIQLPTDAGSKAAPPPKPEEHVTGGLEGTAASGPHELVDYVAPVPLTHVLPDVSQGALRLVVSPITIRITVRISAQGKVLQAESDTRGSTLIDYLSRLAVNASRRWVFQPARRANQTVESETVLVFAFDGHGASARSL